MSSIVPIAINVKYIVDHIDLPSSPRWLGFDYPSLTQNCPRVMKMYCTGHATRPAELEVTFEIAWPLQQTPYTFPLRLNIDSQRLHDPLFLFELKYSHSLILLRHFLAFVIVRISAWTSPATPRSPLAPQI